MVTVDVDTVEDCDKLISGLCLAYLLCCNKFCFTCDLPILILSSMRPSFRLSDGGEAGSCFQLVNVSCARTPFPYTFVINYNAVFILCIGKN